MARPSAGAKLILALAAVLLLAVVPAALAAPPSVIAPDGASEWSYQDLQDVSAKREGAYAAFSGTVTLSITTTQTASNNPLTPNPAEGDAAGAYVNDGYTESPHGGYDTTTAKCKVCHAVHRAEGAYYLLRADSQDDACVYCHIGGSAHSSRVVFDANPQGIYTTNGHTIGAQAQVPDSSVRQYAEPVTLSTTDANGDPVSATVMVRAYDPQKRAMYRFARHHGQGDEGTGRSGFDKIGPVALRCMNCHQVHNAVDEVWRPYDFQPWNPFSATFSPSNTAPQGPFRATGYKLLKRYPSGATTGSPNAYGYYDVGQQITAIEGNAVPAGSTGPWGTESANFSKDYSAAFIFSENGETSAAPIWIAQDIDQPPSSYVQGTGSYRYPYFNNQYALSWWCADCHDLHIGGSAELPSPELGFKTHNERTHPSPFVGAYSGPGQCYSCHRDGLAPQMGLTAAQNPDGHATPTVSTHDTACSRCHYGTLDYYYERGLYAPGSPQYAQYGLDTIDFPHSGTPGSFKMLGSYVVTANTFGNGVPINSTYTAATLGDGNLDGVCLRCHPGVGIHE